MWIECGRSSQLLVAENKTDNQENAIDSVPDEGNISLNGDEKNKVNVSQNQPCQDLDKGADLPAIQFRSRRPLR